MTFSELYYKGLQFLNESGADISAKAEILQIFSDCFGVNRLDMIAKPNLQPTQKQQTDFFEMLNKRKTGYPLQYILGKWKFMGLEFKVGEGVLIPREDTSVLVNTALKYLKNINNPTIIDLCSGSGCIPIILERKLKNSKIYGLEYSEKAIKYFEENIKYHSSSVKCIHGDVFKDFENFNDEYFDAIVSNPPYIKTRDINFLQKEVQHEPVEALDGGNDGLNFYRSICKNWSGKIKPGGALIFEVGFDQADDVKNIMLSNNFFDIKLIKDINDINRVIAGAKSS